MPTCTSSTPRSRGSRVALEGCASIDDLVDRVRAGARDDDGWIEGGGWDPDALGRWPTAADLEHAVPGRRVALWAHDHHALLVSARALAEAGIDDDRGDPDGGVIRRDADGRATGVLHESATRLVASHVPSPTVSTITEALRAYARELLALGVVAVHDPGSLSVRGGLGGPFDAYRELAATGDLALRVHASIRAEQLEAAGEAGLRSGGPLGPDPSTGSGSGGSRRSPTGRSDRARRPSSSRWSPRRASGRPTMVMASGSRSPGGCATSRRGRRRWGSRRRSTGSAMPRCGRPSTRSPRPSGRRP